jgi:hypothetical protein
MRRTRPSLQSVTPHEPESFFQIFLIPYIRSGIAKPLPEIAAHITELRHSTSGTVLSAGHPLYWYRPILPPLYHMNAIQSLFLSECTSLFQKQKSLAERAMAQVPDQDLFTALDAEANSIALIVRHLHGNMRSRWTDFLTTDGEKPDRHRDSEFEPPESETRGDVMRAWEEGWNYLFTALANLTPEHLGQTVHIRSQPLSVMSAILRQLDHYGQHVGQIVLLAKHSRGTEWTSLSIPRGKSQEYLRGLTTGKN